MINNPKDIFLIDDDENVNFYNEDLISEFEEVENVKVLENSLNALAFIEKAKECADFPEIWFVDINMPYLNGFQFVDKAIEIINRLHCNPSIYMLSSSMYDSDAKECEKRSYIKGFLTKPLLASQLNMILKG